jgi:hypothetical protein
MKRTTRSPVEGCKRTVPRWGQVGSMVVVLAVAALVTACGGGSSSPGVASLGSSTTNSNGSIISNGSSTLSSSRASLVRYASCIRSHGITSFPDPNADGQIDLQGLDLKSNPEWHSANEACQSDLPGGGPLKKMKSRVNIQEELTFAACMRSHGITNFPDPNGDGVIQITNPTGILDPNSPQFEAADNACQGHGSAGVPIAISGGGGVSPGSVGNGS